MKIALIHLLKKIIPVFLCCTMAMIVHAQQATFGKNSFLLQLEITGKDSSFNLQALKLQTAFNSQPAALEYVNKLPALLASKGYPTASVDSTWFTDNGMGVMLYTGTKYNWIQLSLVNIEKKAIDETGFNERNFINKPINISQLQYLQQQLLNYYEKQGYPFASVYLDSVHIVDDRIGAVLKADRGVLYHIDSIRVYGKVHLSKKFLQHYLNIYPGSAYDKEKLQQVDKRMLELPYLSPVQPSDLTMLGTGSVLNVYIQPKRSSQVNFLIGFLPASGESGKLQLTGDVNLDLKNLLGSGESLLLKWQQLQQKSPRLNLGYTQPYIFNSMFGFDFLFDLFKKDSSFLQLNGQLGLQYVLSANKTGKVFVQWQSTSLLSGGVDTNSIKVEKRLPPNIDLSSVNVGLNYEWVKTNYRYNPRSGNEMNISTIVGIKNVKQNSDILNIKDPLFNYASLYDSIKPRSYQLRLKLSAAHYFPSGKSGTFKTALNAGYFNSPDIFRNELFQIGGYKLLRGFDEESIYATRYAVFTAEYRYLVGLNSYLMFFTDAGMAQNKYQLVDTKNSFIGAGLGLVYETKLGLLNISYAIGKRDDVKFSLRESSKIHFGYINYF